MNIVELSEKNIVEAKGLFVLAKRSFYEALGQDVESADFESALKIEDASTYMLADKGVYQALVTVNKSASTIENLWINFDIVEEQYLSKFLEFVIKQFSAITLVFYWVDSTDDKVTHLIEDYGFEYTGEQNYVNKENNLLSYRYVYKRKK